MHKIILTLKIYKLNIIVSNSSYLLRIVGIHAFTL